MTEQTKPARLRTWKLWPEKRMPTEYEIVTHLFNTSFRREPVPFELDARAPLNQWYLQHREGSPFQVDDWEQFRDPHRLTYRAYTELKRDQEAFVDGLIDEFEEQDHYAKLSPAWVKWLERGYLPTRFAGHVLQMTAMYVGQMAPSAYIINPAVFQGADELRRIQRCAYIAKALSLEHDASLADSNKARGIWENDPELQPLRKLMEKLLVAYDWGEAFTALNLVVKPVYDAVYTRQFVKLAEENGDPLLAQLQDHYDLDSRRSRDWTGALVRYALERRPELRDVLLTWIDRWTPMAYDAVDGLAELFAAAPQPIPPEQVKRSIHESHEDFLKQVGMR